MKVGDKVCWKEKGLVGTYLGRHYAYHVWWAKVECEDKSILFVQEKILEVVDENG
tara:strand:+ start:444 stop:608 length:165 start_codon:yes stop_codon:yes gene_type:complete